MAGLGRRRAGIVSVLLLVAMLAPCTVTAGEDSREVHVKLQSAAKVRTCEMSSAVLALSPHEVIPLC